MPFVRRRLSLGVNSTVAAEDAARSRALAVLRIRNTALTFVLLPAALAVVLVVAGASGHAAGANWAVLRWVVIGTAAAVLVPAGSVAAVIARARPAVSPTVPVTEDAAPELYRMVRELARRLDVPAPSALELTPDCDSWLEDRSHLPARTVRASATGRGGAIRGPQRRRHQPARPAPVLVIGSPFVWWMRVAELRALLAPVVAGTGPSADPDIAAARRFVRGLDAAVAVAARDTTAGGAGGPERSGIAGPAPAGTTNHRAPRAARALAALLGRPALAFVGWAARDLLCRCRDQIAEMERAVAAAASERAQSVDYGLRIVAQEQVGLAYAGWDRLLTRVALPAWRMGRWPSRLDAGVVAALTELSRRDRLAEGFESRLGERPACDLLEEPGAMDEAASLLAARLFHGTAPRVDGHWSPVPWEEYPQEVVDRIWRSDAARLHRVLDELALPTGASHGAAVIRNGSAGGADAVADRPERGRVTTLARVLDRLAQGGSEELAARISAHQQLEQSTARPEIAPASPAAVGPAGEPVTPVCQLIPPRTGRDLLTDHVTAMVCCAAVDTAGALPGLDWLDGPALLIGGHRRTDLARPVLRLVENGDPVPLRSWLDAVGVRLEMPVRLG